MMKMTDIMTIFRLFLCTDAKIPGTGKVSAGIETEVNVCSWKQRLGGSNLFKNQARDSPVQ